MFSIIKREDFSGFTFLLEVKNPLLAMAVKPGQSAIIMHHAGGGQ